MKFCVITFRSITPAQRGESVLRRAGMECSVQRTPKWMEEQGCGYSLHLRVAHAATAVQLLRSNNIPFRRVYLQRESGNVEEMSL